MSEQKDAFIFVIDNSQSSINGDFIPNRLKSQEIAVSRLIQYFSKLSTPSEFGISAISGNEKGVFVSLTDDTYKLSESVSLLKTGGKADLGTGILCSLLAFKHSLNTFVRKELIVFIGSRNYVDEKEAARIIRTANLEEIGINIVSMGTDVNNDDILEGITKELNVKSVFLKVPPSPHVFLSDLVLTSDIGAGDFSNQILDPDLELTIKMSLEESQDYDINGVDLDKIINESRRDEAMYPHDMEEAIRISKIEEELKKKITKEQFNNK